MKIPIRTRTIVGVLLLVILLTFGGCSLFFIIKSNPRNVVADMTSINLPKNAKLVYKDEQHALSDYTYTYIFRLDHKYNCRELGLISFSDLDEHQKYPHGVDIRVFFSDKYIPKEKIKCLHIKDPIKNGVLIEDGFGAASSDEYISITISGG